MRVFDFPPVTVQHHHARILPTEQWMLRDQFPRQLVVVIRQPRTHSQFLIPIFSRSSILFVIQSAAIVIPGAVEESLILNK